MAFTATVRNLADNTIFASATFDTAAEAEQYAYNEVHGVTGVTWEVTAKLPVKKAKSLIMASRNRDIGLQVQATVPVAESDKYAEVVTGVLHLKAPGTCAALDALYAAAGTEALVPVTISHYALMVG
jgi:hypothetical protein